MHLLRTETVSLDEGAAAIDLGQEPADILFLSFSDSDLSGLASGWRAGGALYPDLRVANIGQLLHHYSVDLYVEKMAPKARFVLVRLLGGLDYWRYGVEELAKAARAHGFDLAIGPATIAPTQGLMRRQRWGRASLKGSTPISNGAGGRISRSA